MNAICTLAVVFLLSACSIGYEPKDQIYEYDLGGKTYRLRLVDGLLTDTAYVFSGDGALAEKSVWTSKDTAGSKTRSFHQHVLFPEPKSPPVPWDSARSTGSILGTIRKMTPDLRHTYNKYLYRRPGFRGRITLRFRIGKEGGIKEVLILENTTGYRNFSLDIVREVAKWSFEPKATSSDDVVTVPFTFSE
jgi:TonB family protein